MSAQQDRAMTTNYGDPAITGGLSVFDPSFDDLFGYDGTDLGIQYSPECTRFRLWAPTAGQAWVNLYEHWYSDQPTKHSMSSDHGGSWVLKLDGNWANHYYTYSVCIGAEIHESIDPYARAVSVNGTHGAILDMSITNPKDWTQAKPQLTNSLDSVIYEVHVRDATIHPSSGIQHKGKYLGLTETTTKGPGGIPTGLDHIASLGITHVQLLPVYDFSMVSVDEARLAVPQYNWGYDPQNYNAPEGSYATDPYDPAVRIRELKQMIQAFHDRGIRVVMDVVYNHVYDGHLIHFTKLVPGYYLRYTPEGTFSDGSGCGNDVASQRRMVRKFIVESVLYWAQEYHLDGFRFDLMGLLDLKTVNEIRQRLTELDPSILLYGEGWDIPTMLPRQQQAILQHASHTPGIGYFNDTIRNAIKGHVFNAESRGFVTGSVGLEQEIRKGIAGSIPYNKDIHGFAIEPEQSINYAECHDNHTLWDKMLISVGTLDPVLLRNMHRLATAIIMTSQGIPFLHAGQEFMRTKNGVENSYNAGDEVNQLDWDRCYDRQDDVAYVKSLVELRKSHPAFRLRTTELIRKHLVFEQSPLSSVAYTLRNYAGGNAEQHLYVIYNSAHGHIEVELPPLGQWKIRFGRELVRRLDGERMTLSEIGMVVLVVTGS